MRYFFYKRWNIVKFRLYGIKIGTNLQAFSRIYLKINDKALVEVGNNVHIISGDSHNPLCRNIQTCLCAERPNSVIEISNDCGLSSPCIWSKDKIVIGNRVLIGGDCIIMDSDGHSLNWNDRNQSQNITSNGFSLDEQITRTAPIFIEDDVLIGTRCIILKGLLLEHAVSLLRAV